MTAGVVAAAVLILSALGAAASCWAIHRPPLRARAREQAGWAAMPAWWTRGYQRAIAIAEARIPYALGGGHDPSRPFLPSKDWRREYASIIGYDCSGAVDAVLHAMGLLSSMPSTRVLEGWGLPGRGQRMTVWVANRTINGHPVEHVVIEFHEGVPAEHRFFMAHFTGGPPAGFSAYFNTTGYTPRRRAA